MSMEMKHITLDGKHDARHLRNALGRFPTGVTVVTTRSPGGGMLGLTANSFAALSLEPPLVLWSINHSSPSVAGFRAAGHFAVNVLRATQVEPLIASPAERTTSSTVSSSPMASAARRSCATCSRPSSARSPRSSTAATTCCSSGASTLAYGDGDPLIFSAGKYCTARALPAGSATSDLKGVWSGLG